MKIGPLLLLLAVALPAGAAPGEVDFSLGAGAALRPAWRRTGSSPARAGGGP